MFHTCLLKHLNTYDYKWSKRALCYYNTMLFHNMIKVLKLQYDNIMTLCVINIVGIIKQTCYVIMITMSYII